MCVLTEPGDRVLILLPGGRPGGVADLLITGLNRLGTRGIHPGPVADSERTLQVIAAEAATVLVGIPAQVLALARSSGSAEVPVQRVLLSTDRVPRAVAAEIERRWNCEVYSHCGMNELGFGGEVEAAIGEALHSIPSLRRALASERIATSITIVPANGRCRPLSAKRVLADLRGESMS